MAVEIRDRKNYFKIPYYIHNNKLYRIDNTIPYRVHQYDRDVRQERYNITSFA